MLLDHFEKHLSEAIDGIGGEAFGIREVTDGIEGTENIRRAVD
jgi:hypothetical protein